MPAAPATLAAGTVTATGVPLTWDAVTGAAKYRVDYRVSGAEGWTTDDDTLTTAAHTVDDLTCNTAYEFRVSAYGDGVTLAAAWGTASTVTATTGACGPCNPLVVTTPTLTVGATAGARSAVTAAWTYGNGCVDLAVARNELYWTYVYADGTQRSVSLQASGDSPVTWRVHLTHRDSGSPLTRVTWTYLRLTLGNERVAFTFTDPPSVTFNQAPTFAKASYAFTIAENAAVAAAVGRVAATDPDAGDALTYAITAGNTGGAFAIDASSGALMVAAALDHETTASYTLTVQASDGNGKSATATVTATVTDVAE